MRKQNKDLQQTTNTKSVVEAQSGVKQIICGKKSLKVNTNFAYMPHICTVE